MRKWYILFDYIKSLNLYNRIKKAEKRIGELCAHTSYLQNEARMLQWQIHNPSKFKIGTKVKTKNGIGYICDIKPIQGCYGIGNHYNYIINIKCQNYGFHETDINEHQPQKRTTKVGLKGRSK